MGIVPWVERSHAQADDATVLRDAIVAAETDYEQSQQAVVAENQPAITHAQPPIDAHPANEPITDSSSLNKPVDFMQTQLVEIPFRGQYVTQLGSISAPLLILVEAISTQQSRYPFESADAKIFEDMLRAIAWRRQDVCLGVLPPASAPSMFSDSVSDSFSGSFSGSKSSVVGDLCQTHRDAVLLFCHSLPDSLNSDDLIVPLAREGMMAWQLPHPTLLRESPVRKRQAWNVLKAARARLG